jgi:hypothetical protein
LVGILSKGNVRTAAGGHFSAKFPGFVAELFLLVGKIEIHGETTFY